MQSFNYQCQPAGPLSGELLVPGDKSLSHRAVILAALADGVTDISGFLPGADNLATLNAMRQLGVPVDYTDGESRLQIKGVGLRGLRRSEQALDLGNAGTGIRLLMGLLSWQPFASELTGDASLKARPMRRIADPLNQMGAEVCLTPQNTAPVRITARHSALSPISYTMPVASAQIKSAILLAGLGASGPVEITDPGVSRDHSERMMRYLGIPVQSKGNVVRLTPCESFAAQPLEVVGDISSAAFFMVAASIVPGSDILLKNVGVNPTRTGVIELLQRMGADLILCDERISAGGEPVADIRVRYAELKGIDIGSHDVPRAIDELPVLLIAAACAQGQTQLSGAGELRVKECDRLEAMATGLKAMGAVLVETPDGMILQGGQLKGATVNSFDDHRIAMAFAVAAAVAVGETIVQDVAQVQTSFPSFNASARELGLPIKETKHDG
jgi:3-phosphoshikimate 1-carboxyvinyltransferase